MKRILLFLLAVIGCSQSYPQAGTLDPSFGKNGMVVSDFYAPVNVYTVFCKKLLPGKNGSFFVVIEMNEQTLLTHRLADGSLDKNYGENGFSEAAFMHNSTAVLQPDGKIVAGGYSMVNNSIDFTLARFNTDGSLDHSFSGDGVANFDFSSKEDLINAIALQADGKIVAAGFTGSAGNYDFAVIRVNANGSLDPGFSGDGKLTSHFLDNNVANAVAVQADGKIVVAGNAGSNIVVVRYLSNGTLDNSFSVGGTVMIYANSTAKEVVMQPDGKIILAGSVINSGNQDFLLMRLNTNGSLDGSFSWDGQLNTDFGGNEVAEALALQPNGKILAGGSSSQSGGFGSFVIARYNADGSLDNSFSGGKLVTYVGNVYDVILDLAVQTDGRILAAGESFNPKALINYAVVRYLSNGSLDPSFADNGKLIAYNPKAETGFHAVAIQKDGKIIASGLTDRGNGFECAVVRYNRDGSLDRNFAQNGKKVFDFGFGDAQALSAAVLNNGKILLGGLAFNGRDHDFALARLNANGSLDASFDGDGKLLSDLRGSDDGSIAMVIQPDGKIVLAGFSKKTPSTQDVALARYLPDGSPDLSFGVNGKQFTDLGGIDDEARALLLQPDGKLVITGFYSVGGATRFFLSRYSANGWPDLSFGTGGIVVSDITEGANLAYAAALQPDGKIVVAGNIYSANKGSDILLVRYNSNGSLDSSFSGDGKVFFDMGSNQEGAQALIIEQDKKIIAAGYMDNGSSMVHAVVRFDENGNLDQGFSSDGIITGEPGRSLLYGLAIDGKRLYAVGSAVRDGSQAGTVTAYSLGPTCPGSFTVFIPDAMSLNKGVFPNTVYPGYAPASQIILCAKAYGGHAPYNYLWSSGASSPNISVSPLVNTSYVVTVTDALGCRVTAAKQVYAVDVRCGNNNDKVSICQDSWGYGRKKTVCIAGAAVAAHLKAGAMLGSCEQQGTIDCHDKKHDTKMSAGLVVWPNPSSGSFKLQLNNGEPGIYLLIVRDAMGRIVEQRKVNSQLVIEIGKNYRVGTYFVSVVQGTRTMSVRIIKE